MNKGSRTVYIFFALIIITLVSGVAISLFMLQKETQGRNSVEKSLEDLRLRNMKVEAALQEARKQIDVLEGKNKDADDKINNLLSEIDLGTALREEIKAENKKLKDALDAETKARKEVKARLSADLESAQKMLAEAEGKATTSAEERLALQEKVDALKQENQELKRQVQALNDGQLARLDYNEIIPSPAEFLQDKVELDRIVITPDDAVEGRVLNVDVETEFLIFDLGSRHGIREGEIMSIYRGNRYLGDVKVSRVQKEMSAADFIPPFSSRKVRKNDQVVPKK